MGYLKKDPKATTSDRHSQADGGQKPSSKKKIWDLFSTLAEVTFEEAGLGDLLGVDRLLFGSQLLLNDHHVIQRLSSLLDQLLIRSGQRFHCKNKKQSQTGNYGRIYTPQCALWVYILIAKLRSVFEVPLELSLIHI